MGLDLLQSVYGIEKPTEYITFEDKVMLDHTSFINGKKTWLTESETVARLFEMYEELTK